MKSILNRVKNEGVVTHFGSDLDQILTLEALRRAAGADEIKVDRAPAGKPVASRIMLT